jgi:hypothetical protein
MAKPSHTGLRGSGGNCLNKRLLLFQIQIILLSLWTAAIMSCFCNLAAHSLLLMKGIPNLLPAFSVVFEPCEAFLDLASPRAPVWRQIT